MSAIRNTMIGAGLALLTAGAASANPAVAENELNMRMGPGPQYPILISMPRGANARAWNCDGAWCRVSWNGHSGFASQRYLDITLYPPTAMRARVPEAAYVTAPAVAYTTTQGYDDYAYAPEYRTYGYRQDYQTNGYQPDYPTNGYQPAALPTPLDFPLLPWNWGR